MYGIVDCNNFYASCERLFRPDLKHTPIVVLSNNDGCVIARSNEAKAIDIKMGEPVFKIKRLLREQNVQVFSANFTLYGDLSNRVMSVLSKLERDIEIYSIDEAFIRFETNNLNELSIRAELITSVIEQHTGIPVTVGVGPTKTLAKLANKVAKTQKRKTWYLAGNEKRLASMGISNIWGIGRQLTHRLNNMGIDMVTQLKELHPPLARKIAGVVLERTIRELNGIACIELETLQPKQSIMVSRSFGQTVGIDGVRAAVNNFCALASEKLNTQDSNAQFLTVFVASNRFDKHSDYTSASYTVNFDRPTHAISDIAQLANRILPMIMEKDTAYKKAGIMLGGLVKCSQAQAALMFETPTPKDVSDVYSDIVDRYGSAAIQFAVAGTNQDWKMNQSHLSPKYTTKWEDVPVVQ